MSIGHGDVKRQGLPKAIDKHGEDVTINTTLNESPDSVWRACFKRPSK